MQAMCELARNQGSSWSLAAKSDLDTRVDGRHQGVVAVLHAGVQHEAAGMISEADLMERVADAPSPCY